MISFVSTMPLSPIALLVAIETIIQPIDLFSSLDTLKKLSPKLS